MFGVLTHRFLLIRFDELMESKFLEALDRSNWTRSCYS